MLSSGQNSKQTILVVDDEVSIRQVLATRLTLAGYAVVTAADGEVALKAFHQSTPDLIVLDVMMPKLDGYQVCQALRQISEVPIILLTAMAEVAHRITGLELGADDYLTKPFSPKELEARIHSVLRRGKRTSTANHSRARVFHIGDLQIDMNKHQVYKGSERIRLTEMEFRVLELLVDRVNTPISRTEILQQVWGYTPDQYVDTRVVDVHIFRLRAKVEADPKHPALIRTSRGHGYVLQPLNAEV
ncbi:MAG TPA: response regulator [Candidatus Caenarcaniphilales bacterium]